MMRSFNWLERHKTASGWTKRTESADKWAWVAQGSRYAQALATGIHRIRMVDKFLRGTIDDAAFVTTLKR